MSAQPALRMTAPCLQRASTVDPLKGASMVTTQEDRMYVMGRSDHETARLQRQAQLYGPLTRRLFIEAGVGAGMRVLDVGSGAGDVALLVAELVGPVGQVVGVDTNAHILDVARSRVQAAGWTN